MFCGQNTAAITTLSVTSAHSNRPPDSSSSSSFCCRRLLPLKIPKKIHKNHPFRLTRLHEKRKLFVKMWNQSLSVVWWTKQGSQQKEEKQQKPTYGIDRGRSSTIWPVVRRLCPPTTRSVFYGSSLCVRPLVTRRTSCAPFFTHAQHYCCPACVFLRAEWVCRHDYTAGNVSPNWWSRPVEHRQRCRCCCCKTEVHKITIVSCQPTCAVQTKA